MSNLALVSAASTVDELDAAIGSGLPVLIADAPDTLDPGIVTQLVECVDRAGVGTASPVPVDGVDHPRTYPVHAASPPAASLALPCRNLCVLGPDALASLAAERLPGASVAERLRHLAIRMVQHGWRHVVAPGVAWTWDPEAWSGGESVAGWSRATVSSIVGPANPGLEAHRSWAKVQTGQLRLVVDGACMSTEPYTGTQHLVLEVSRHLAATRPSAEVSLAVKRSAIEPVKAALGASEVAVVDRGESVDADVVYRPYQMLYAGELDFVLRTGRRGLVGQLDMIGFSNPFYHPADQLFFFARNLQRHLMRTLDGVTFISVFGRESTIAECPDLEPDRLHVVYCGADPSPTQGSFAPHRQIDDQARFITCLASTFWHKNRTHAIATFATMVKAHGYSGDIVIAGPEPFYGRSLEAEDDLIASLPDNVGRRIHRWGHISEPEKWWLLSHADVVLYPSIVEGFGLVPFEAAAAGTPCLVSDATAPGELLGATDAVVGSWDHRVWAERAHTLASDSKDANALVEQIARTADGLTWERCAHVTWQAIDHALAAPSRMRHADDGGRIARVGHAASGSALARATGFDAARALPALRRRARAARDKAMRKPTDGASR